MRQRTEEDLFFKAAGLSTSVPQTELTPNAAVIKGFGRPRCAVVLLKIVFSHEQKAATEIEIRESIVLKVRGGFVKSMMP